MTTANPRDEAFYHQDFGISLPEDPLSCHMKAEVRELARKTSEEIGSLLLPDKPVVLEFPDPYRLDISEADLSSIEKDTEDAATILGGGKAGSSKDGSSKDGNLVQIRRVIISAAKIQDSRGASSNSSGMSYELILSEEAKDSGLFAVGSNSKGNVAAGSDVIISIGCTLPRPQGLGGLTVGSWQMFKANVMMKGGWKNDDVPDEFSVPILLKGFVRL